MSEREDRLRSLLNKVRAKRPDGRTTRAADALDRIRTASGTTAAAAAHSSPAAPPPPEKRQSSRPVPIEGFAPSTVPPTPVPSSFPTQLPSSPLPEPPTSPSLESPTRYSSQPPRVERPLSVEPRAQPVRHSSGAPAGPSSDTPARASSGVPARPSSGAPAGTSSSGRPESIRPQSVAPTGQPVVYATDPPEFPRAKTFGDLLDLTLSLRPR
jgi:hypothetical protein